MRPSWGYLGAILGLSWAIIGHLGAILGRLGSFFPRCVQEGSKKAISRKPASLEAWLEVSRQERPKGVGGLPGSSPQIKVFWSQFWIQFWIVLWKDFRHELDPKTSPKLVPKFTKFGSSFGPPPFRGLRALLHALGRASGLLGAVPGGLQSEKVTTVLCKNHFFENSLFRFLAALDGPLRPILAPLGPILRPN